jgi:GTP-binding protein
MSTGSRPLVAIVGRPNVGKSSLVNRVLGRREAIVEATPGVTRDRSGFMTEWNGREFEIMDTGGLEPGAEGLDARVVEQARLAMEAADVIVLVVDAVSGPLEDDHLVAQELRGADKPVLLVANKVDDPRDEPATAAFHRLGLGDPIPMSALHGRGSGDFLQQLIRHLPSAGPELDEAWASVAIVGRPNVGKSSILNALLGTERSIVDSVPGTTRDPVDSYVELGDGRKLRIVDTAGMRREVLVKESLEYYSLIRSRAALARADVALLVTDASEGITSHDQRIAEQIVESGRACVIVRNKWDLLADEEDVDRKRREDDATRKFRFLPWAISIRTSALSGRGLNKVVPAVLDAVEAHRTRLSTSAVNQVLGDAQDEKPHPRVGGRAIRILYGLQAGVGPPRFVFFSNGRIETAYLRYLEKRLRRREPFQGSPLKFEVRVKTRHKVET